MVYRIIFFLVLNFGALVIGSYFTEAGVLSEWYSNLDKAPWTPPGWMFGAAWSIIMVCFAIYMAYGTKQINSRGLLSTFGIQWVLNVLWNLAFFYYQSISAGLIIISALTILVAYMLYHYWSRLKNKSFWLAPYLLWMLIATSLNAYIFIRN